MKKKRPGLSPRWQWQRSKSTVPIIATKKIMCGARQKSNEARGRVQKIYSIFKSQRARALWNVRNYPGEIFVSRKNTPRGLVSHCALKGSLEGAPKNLRGFPIEIYNCTFQTSSSSPVEKCKSKMSFDFRSHWSDSSSNGFLTHPRIGWLL